MQRLAVLSMHTSPLAQPGLGDGGGMNVYVRELSAALARAGVECDVYTRAWSPSLRSTVYVEPGFRVHHVPAGPLEPVAKEDLPGLVDQFADGVLKHLTTDRPAQAIHANYWLSGMAGHRLKHELDLPLVSTFHTLARVKAEAAGDESHQREHAESTVMGCSDAVLASCSVEAHQIADLYGLDRTRIEIVAPGVERAFFAPGYRPQARRALDLPADRPMLLFVGRIQPLKGLDVAVRSLAALSDEYPDAFLVVVGGPSGPQGEAEEARVRDLVTACGLDGRVRFCPPQPHELLSTFYRAADVCLVPSRSESFGLVALEAAACGTPVVAAAVGGLRTLVDHGYSGFLVEGRHPETFAAYAAELLSNPLLAAEMSANGAERAGRYTWRQAATSLRHLYDELTERSLVECR
jgi:D-inositol-3-phosphate glycosyltransferase